MEPGKQKIAAPQDLVLRTLECLQKSGATGKECKDEEGLKGRRGLDEKWSQSQVPNFRDIAGSQATQLSF